MRTVLCIAALLLPVHAFAVDPVPNEFEEGDVVSAQAMNDNFAALTEAISDLEALVDQLDLDLNASETSVTGLVAEVDVLASAITSVQGAVDSAIPNGTLAFFETASCPSGWSDVPGAHGRVVVALPNGGSLSGTVGTGLSNLQNPVHDHSVNPPNQTVAIGSAGSHNHQWMNGGITYNESGNQSVPVVTFPYGVGSLSSLRLLANQDYFTSNEGAHTHSASVDLPATTSSSVSSTMPYVQYRLCKYNS